ncbi:MAG: TonB-dependent receptor [Bacteroidales bacterium]|nr:TonB-dependent receptor [Bacteroidales bacterium]
MKRFSFILLLAIFALPLSAQTVKGVLTDDETGEAIPFANVVLDKTRYGVATDINGFYLINKMPEGTYTLRVRFVGYQEYTEEITIEKKQTIVRNIKLKPDKKMLDEVKVTDNRIEERKIQTQVSVEKITSTQIQQMPSIGGTADLAQYLQILPGISSTGDQGGQLYIRGGSMVQNLCLLDGMTVYNPFHSIGLYSIFETDIILNADVYSAGYGAQYGGRISSVMDINTRDGNKKRHGGKLSLNTFGANILLEGPIKKETSESPFTISYLLSAKNSFLSRSSKFLYNQSLPFDFLDLYGKVSVNSGSGSKVNLFGFRFDDQVIGYQSLANFHWQNYGLGTNFMIVTGSSSILEGHLAYSDYKIKMTNQFEDSSGINNFNMGLDVTNFVGSNRLKYGLDMQLASTYLSYHNSYNRLIYFSPVSTTSIAAYITYKIATGKWLIDPGFRLIFYDIGVASPEPRISAKYNISDLFRLKMAAGLYSQNYIDTRSDNDIVNLFSGFINANANVFPDSFRSNTANTCIQRSQHVVLGAEYDFTTHLTTNMEFYFKNFNQLLNLNSNKMFDENDAAYKPGGAYEKPEFYLSNYVVESGFSYGMDLSFCYDIDWLYLWATYSLGWVHRNNGVFTYHPHYDRRHTINLLTTIRLGELHEWEISGRWSYGSGFPFTQTQGVYENVSFADGINTDFTRTNGIYGVVYGDYYAGRLPNYHRLDLSVKRKFSIGKRSILEVNASVTNVYNRNNIFYFDRLTFTRIDQLPFMWSAGLTFRF